MKATVIYDADCGLCTNVRDVCQALDWFGSLRWLAQQDGEAAAFGISQHDLQRSVYFVTESGRTYHRFDAVKQILLRLPASWMIAGAIAGKKPAAAIPIALLFSPVFQPVGDAAYDLVARNRYKFPGSTCAVELGATPGHARMPVEGAAVNSDGTPTRAGRNHSGISSREV